MENKQTPLVLVFTSLQLHEFAPKGSLMYVIYLLGVGEAVKFTKNNKKPQINKKSFLSILKKHIVEFLNPHHNCVSCSW